MPTAMKRPAAATFVSVAVKKTKTQKTVKPIVPKRDPSVVAVAKGLALADMPDNVRTMLDEMLDFSIAVFADQRDKYMQEVVDLIGGVLQGHIDRCKADAAGFQKWMEEGEAARAAQQGIVESLGSELHSHQPVVWERVKELAAVAKQFHSTREAVKQQEADIVLLEQERFASRELQHLVESTIKEIFHPLCEEGGSRESKEATANVEKLCSVLASANVDADMVSALPSVLLKEVANRGAFDIMVLQQVKTEAESRVESFNELNKVHAQKRAESNTKLADARGVFEAARDEQIAKASALKAAKSMDSELLEKLNEAKDQLSAQGKSLRGFQREFNAVTRRLGSFSDGPYAAFERLRDRTTPRETEEVTAEVTGIEIEGQVGAESTEVLPILAAIA